MVMTAARHYWNACCPLVSQPIERELLREPIRIILECITGTAEKLKKKEVSNSIIFFIKINLMKSVKSKDIHSFSSTK